MVVIYKLRLIPGLEFFSFIDNNVIFHRDAFIENILLKKNKISGLSSIEGNVALHTGQSSMRINSNGISIQAPIGFEIRNPNTGQRLYPFELSTTPLDTMKTLSVPNGVRDVKMIRSPVDENLLLNAKQKITIRGNEGVKIKGKSIEMEASSIFLSSINSSIVLDGHHGVYLNLDSILIVKNFTTSPDGENLQFKLCACGRNGRIFRIPIKDSSTSCADVRFPQSENPCL